MPEHIQYEDNDLFNPETHHEHSDVPVRPLFWFIGIFIVFAIVSHVALFLLYKAFATGERNRMDPPQTQVARPGDASLPPRNQPLLQPFPRGEVVPYRQTPVTDLEDMRHHEKQVLESYGWVDKQTGVVHIPIEEAKKRFAAQAAVSGAAGAPASPPAGAGPSPAPPPGANAAPAGTSVPTDTGAVPSAAATTGGHR